MSVLRHDLRTPLNSIALLAQSLTELGSADRDLPETATQIRSSAMAVDRMLTDFLHFAVSRLGRPIPVTPAPMDLAELCKEVVAEVRPSCPRCHWQMNFAGELRGEWDPPRLRQMLSNLVSNAVQHGDQTAEIAVSAVSDGSRVELSVHNDGVPIPEEFLPRIFEPYVRGPNSRECVGSAGMGLYIAREVAVAHKGTITVKSTRESGTTFTVTLPLRCDPHAG